MVKDEDRKVWSAFIRGIKPLHQDRVISNPQGIIQDERSPMEVMDDQLNYNLHAYTRSNPDRLDLHGFSIHDAYHSVNHFIYESWSCGLKYVIVITGHGEGTTSISKELPIWCRTGVSSEYVADVFSSRPESQPGAYTIRLKPNPEYR